MQDSSPPSEVHTRQVQNDCDRLETHGLASPSNTSRTSITLPPEIWRCILVWLVLDVEHLETYGPPCDYQHHQSCSFHQCHKARMLWLTTKLAAVNSTFFHFLSPFLLPYLSLTSGRPLDDGRMAFYGSPTFLSAMRHLRHLRINFDQLAISVPSNQTHPTLWLVHIFSICLNATRLESLEWSDLVLNVGDKADFGYSVAPFRSFDPARPLPFDPTASQLLSLLPNLAADGDTKPNDDAPTGMERQLLDIWGNDAVQNLVHLLADAASHPSFPRLQHVLFCDGNGGISLDDYANLFLVDSHRSLPRVHSPNKNEPCSDKLSPTCDTYGHPACTLVTTCPSLSSLTLVLWYEELQIQAAFLHAMLHLAQHHAHLEHLDLISRRLRYDPQVVGNSLSMSEWFQFDVVPNLKLAEQLVSTLSQSRSGCDLKMTIHILSNHAQRRELSDVVRMYWNATEPAQSKIKVNILEVYDFKSSLVFAEAAKWHRQRVNAGMYTEAVRAARAYSSESVGSGQAQVDRFFAALQYRFLSRLFGDS